jgi:hypothetical protein
MEVATMNWTDERLDDLSDAVAVLHKDTKDEFKSVHDEFKAVRSEMKDEFKAVRSEMKEEFGAVRSEMHTGFEAMHRLMVFVLCAVIGALTTMLAALIAMGL